MMKLTIKTPYVTANKMYTFNRYNGRKTLTKMARLRKQQMIEEIEDQLGDRKPYKGEVRVELYWYMPDARRRDQDNLKMVYDSMSKLCYGDDSDIWERVERKYIDRDNPRIEVIISR